MTGVLYIITAAFTAWFAHEVDDVADGRILEEYSTLLPALFWPIYLPLFIWAYFRLRSARRRPPPKGRKPLAPVIIMRPRIVGVVDSIEQERRAA